MNWHYQVMRHIEKVSETETYEWYAIREYYESEEDNKHAWSLTATLTGDSVEDLKQRLKMMEQDIYKHGVIDYE